MCSKISGKKILYKTLRKMLPIYIGFLEEEPDCASLLVAYPWLHHIQDLNAACGDKSGSIALRCSSGVWSMAVRSPTRSLFTRSLRDGPSKPHSKWPEHHGHLSSSCVLSLSGLYSQMIHLISFSDVNNPPKFQGCLERTCYSRWHNHLIFASWLLHFQKSNWKKWKISVLSVVEYVF